MGKYNIDVADTWYVEISIATLLAQHNNVTAIDVIPQKIDSAVHTFPRSSSKLSNRRFLPILYMGMKEAETVKFFANTSLRVNYFNELDTHAGVKRSPSSNGSPRSSSPTAPPPTSPILYLKSILETSSIKTKLRIQH